MGYYIKIADGPYEEDGEVVLDGRPMTFWEIYEQEDLEDDLSGYYSFFGIHSMDALTALINALGGKRGEFISYLLKSKDSRNQIMDKRVSDLAKSAGVSIQSANDAIKIMKDNGLMKSSTKNFMINPKLDRRGQKKRQVFLAKVYAEFKDRSSKIGLDKLL